ncbi:hypothetical protein P3T73_00525 [Kiritimatiellota bacterium B12222]|nr:hypothetical protein P3T73_00525 [Kiritimatiellota bacterium B12222]
MKRSILLLCFCLLHPLFGQELQTWSSTNGHTFQGSFVSLENQVITLRGDDGRNVSVPLSALDTESQVQGRKAQAEAMANAPVFTHQNRYLRFSLSPKTQWLQVEFLQGSTVLNQQSYDVSIRFAEIRANNDWHETGVKELYGKIEKNRDSVVMRLLMDNGVVLKFVVDLNDKAELSYEFEVGVVPEGLPQLDFRTAMNFPKLLSYNMETESYVGALSSSGIPFDGLERFFEGYEVLVEPREGKGSKVLYSEKQTDEYRAKAFTVKIPGKKSLKIEAPKSEAEGSMYIWFYNGKAAFEGYNILMHSKARNNLGGGPYTLSLK